MIRSCVFGLLALTLCLVNCLCANATHSTVSADENVAEVQKSLKGVIADADSRLTTANNTISRMEHFKELAERAKSKADKRTKENEEIQKVVKQVQDASDKIVDLYQKYYTTAIKYRDDIMALHKNATELDKASKLWSAGSANAKASKQLTNIEDTNNKAKELKETVQRMPLPSDVETAEGNISNYYEKIQLAEYHFESIDKVANMNKYLKEADTYIKNTELERDKVNATLKEMKKLYKNLPADLTKHIDSLYTVAEAEFTSASGAIKRAEDAKNVMVKEKPEADIAFAKVTSAQTSNAAASAVYDADQLYRKIANAFDTIRWALNSAKNSAAKAENKRKEAEEKISERNTKKDTAKGTETAKSSNAKERSGIVEHITGHSLKIEKMEVPKMQSGISNPEKSIIGTFEKPMHKVSDQSIINAKSEETKGEKTEQTNAEQIKQINREKIYALVQHNMNLSAVAGKVPQWGPRQDSAVTVSVQLLMTMIVCAALL